MANKVSTAKQLQHFDSEMTPCHCVTHQFWGIDCMSVTWVDKKGNRGRCYGIMQCDKCEMQFEYDSRHGIEVAHHEPLTVVI